MTFADYLKKHGPSVKQLAEMPAEAREWAAKNAYEIWARREDLRGSGTDFLNGWRLCKEVKVWQHMAQDARTAAEGCPRCGEPVDRSGEYGIVCAKCWADDEQIAKTEREEACE